MDHPTTNKPLVYVAEPSGVFRKIIQRACDEHGLEMVTCSGVSDTLDKVLALKPACVLSEITLPDLSGSTLAAALKTNKDTQDIPLGVLTPPTQKDSPVFFTLANQIIWKTTSFAKYLDIFFTSLGYAKVRQSQKVRTVPSTKIPSSKSQDTKPTEQA